MKIKTFLLPLLFLSSVFLIFPASSYSQTSESGPLELPIAEIKNPQSCDLDNSGGLSVQELEKMDFGVISFLANHAIASGSRTPEQVYRILAGLEPTKKEDIGKDLNDIRDILNSQLFSVASRAKLIAMLSRDDMQMAAGVFLNGDKYYSAEPYTNAPGLLGAVTLLFMKNEMSEDEFNDFVSQCEDYANDRTAVILALSEHIFEKTSLADLADKPIFELGSLNIKE